MNVLEQIDVLQKSIGGPFAGFLATYWLVPVFLILAIAGYLIASSRGDNLIDIPFVDDAGSDGDGGSGD
jgi:hypothetical protein